MDRVRASGPSALRLDLSSRDWIAIDVSASCAGVWLVPRSVEVPADPREPEGPSKPALLLFRKHLAGAIVDGVERAPDGVILKFTEGGSLVEVHARLRRPCSATLNRGGRDLATFGAAGAASPERGPTGEPAPVEPLAPALRYAELRSAALLAARLKEARARAKAELARLERLRAALERDRAGWPDTAQLRHEGEALLASGLNAPPGTASVTVPDPRGGPEIRVELKRGLGVARTADALFKRARALEGRRSAFEDRLAGVERDIAAARTELARLASVERLEDAPSAPPARDGAAADSAAPWRFITSRGLPVWVGRTAAENHELTFAKARPEDVWLHVLDAPGAHVILRNLDGRATPADIAEAAAVAAWHSARRGEAAVDVQHCARKHVHPAPGGKGRVIAGHREVVRVAPRDPRGWLRRR